MIRFRGPVGRVLTGLVLLGLGTMNASADNARGALIDASSPLLRGQVGIFPEGSGQVLGNGFVVDKDGCEILTAYHVAFAAAIGPNQEFIYANKIEYGVKVPVGVEINGNPGTYARRVVGSVIGIGDFDNTPFGQSNDLVLLQLDECLGPKVAATVPLSTEPSEQTLPPGGVLVIHTDWSKNRTARLLIEENCSTQRILTNGVYALDCPSRPGDSGDRVVRKTRDGYEVVGMVVAVKQGLKLSYALTAKKMRDFIEEQHELYREFLRTSGEKTK